MKTLFALSLATALLGACTPAQKPPAKVKAPDGVNDFTLTDHEGKSHSLYAGAAAPAFVIVAQGNDCPIVQKYASRLKELGEKWTKRGVPFFLINANTQDTAATVAKEVKEYGFGLPVLLDPGQEVTKSLGITRTAEAVILEPGTWRVIYRGAIDDRLTYGVDKREPKAHFLDDALEDISAARPIRAMPPPAKGCAITFRK